MTENEKLVISAAKCVTSKLSRRFTSVSREDILSTAYLGAIEALNKFDGTRGTSLFSYAYRSSHRAVIRFLSKTLYGSSCVLEEHRSAAEHAHIEIPTEEQWDVASDVDAHIALLGEDADEFMAENIGYPGVKNKRMVEALGKLSPKYRDLVYEIVILGKSFSEVAAETGRRVYFLKKQFEQAMDVLRTNLVGELN